MMYYVDHSDTLNVILGGNGVGFSHIENDDPDECPCVEGDLIFLHTEYSVEWINYAQSHQGMHFVFISRGAPNFLPRENELPENAHLCHIPANNLDNHSRFTEFLRQWGSGHKRWDLLLLPNYPEHLVAAYLVGIAIREGVVLQNSELSTDLWGKATEEYRRLSTTDNSNLTMDNIKEYLGQVETVLCKVGQV